MNQAKNPEWQAGWVDIAVEQCVLVKIFNLPKKEKLQMRSRLKHHVEGAKDYVDC